MDIDKILEAAFPYFEWLGLEDSEFRLFALLAVGLLVVALLFFIKEKAGYKFAVFLCLLAGIAGVGYFARTAVSSTDRAHFDDEWEYWANAFGEKCQATDLDAQANAVRQLYGEAKPIVDRIRHNNGQILFTYASDVNFDIAVNPIDVATTNTMHNVAGGILQVACMPRKSCTAPIYGDQTAPIFVFANTDCASLAGSLLQRAVDPSAPLQGGVIFMDF
ncbi:MAG: hypothetical protein AAF227_06540 [Pseudomonadota bacterium]